MTAKIRRSIAQSIDRIEYKGALVFLGSASLALILANCTGATCQQAAQFYQDCYAGTQPGQSFSTSNCEKGLGAACLPQEQDGLQAMMSCLENSWQCSNGAPTVEGSYATVGTCVSPDVSTACQNAASNAGIPIIIPSNLPTATPS